MFLKDGELSKLSRKGMQPRYFILVSVHLITDNFFALSTWVSFSLGSLFSLYLYLCLPLCSLLTHLHPEFLVTYNQLYPVFGKTSENTGRFCFVIFIIGHLGLILHQLLCIFKILCIIMQWRNYLNNFFFVYPKVTIP